MTYLRILTKKPENVRVWPMFYNLFYATLCLQLFSVTAYALVLEDLVSQDKLVSILSNKKVGYYIGSFDPLHLGHEELARAPIEKGFCDYVIVYPSWGNDTYKKRIALEDRLKMLFSVFEKHPWVIVTKLSPRRLQDTLTVSTHGDKTEAAFPGTEFIGIIGSDIAIEVNSNQEVLQRFMRGIRIPDKWAEHTIGGNMVLPVSRFIVSIRNGEDISALNGKLSDRTIMATIQNEKASTISSTTVKKALQTNLSVKNLLSSAVETIIQEGKHYSKQ